MTCMLTTDFHANQIVFVWSCVKRLGTNGFKFPAKGSLPVILSSMVLPYLTNSSNTSDHNKHSDHFRKFTKVIICLMR